VNGERVVALLRAYRFDESSEDALQRGVDVVLRDTWFGFEREARLSARDRIDFLVGGLGIECKVDGSTAEVARQLERYAKLDAIDELVLVTTKNRHRAVPREMNGKRVLVHVTMGGLR
jgi:hypothetical protein